LTPATTLFDLLHRDRQRCRAYREAIDALVMPKGGPCKSTPCHRTFLQRAEMTREFCVEKLMAAARSRPHADPDLSQTDRQAVQRTRTLCHRDYHGQNIHIKKAFYYRLSGSGPDTYDSCARDRGVRASPATKPGGAGHSWSVAGGGPLRTR
jgi:hypothetical protein